MRALLALTAGAVIAAVAWWATAIRQFFEPQLAPSVLADTVPMVLAFVLGALAVLLAAIAAAVGARSRLAVALLGGTALLAAGGPVWVVGNTFITVNDWNFANRTFLASYLPAAAFALSYSLDRVDHLPHYVVHHAHPLPGWEIADLEREWRRLRASTADEPRQGIELYLNDANADALGIGSHGAAYGPLVVARPLTLVDPCQGGVLHEIAHAFMYVQSRGNTFPQILDEGWAVANEGCPEPVLDTRVLEDIQRGLMPPLEDRLNSAGFRRSEYGGTQTGYDAGGSWVAWLLAQYGAPRFMAFINSATSSNCMARSQAVYGRSFSALEREWLLHIAHEFGMRTLSFTGEGG
jgi:hypothetical protein